MLSLKVKPVVLAIISLGLVAGLASSAYAQMVELSTGQEQAAAVDFAKRVLAEKTQEGIKSSANKGSNAAGAIRIISTASLWSPRDGAEATLKPSPYGGDLYLNLEPEMTAKVPVSYKGQTMQLKDVPGLGNPSTRALFLLGEVAQKPLPTDASGIILADVGLGNAPRGDLSTTAYTVGFLMSRSNTPLALDLSGNGLDRDQSAEFVTGISRYMGRSGRIGQLQLNRNPIDFSGKGWSEASKALRDKVNAVSLDVNKSNAASAGDFVARTHIPAVMARYLDRPSVQPFNAAVAKDSALTTDTSVFARDVELRDEDENALVNTVQARRGQLVGYGCYQVDASPANQKAFLGALDAAAKANPHTLTSVGVGFRVTGPNARKLAVALDNMPQILKTVSFANDALSTSATRKTFVEFAKARPGVGFVTYNSGAFADAAEDNFSRAVLSAKRPILLGGRDAAEYRKKVGATGRSEQGPKESAWGYDWEFTPGYNTVKSPRVRDGLDGLGLRKAQRNTAQAVGLSRFGDAMQLD